MKPLNIKKPCPEDWSKMKIGLISRHCEVCNHAVIDFTRMSREEILEYLFTHRNEKVCGRFEKSQLDITHEEFLITINTISKKRKNSNLAFYLLSLGALLFTSCNSSSIAPDPHKTSCFISTTDSSAKTNISRNNQFPDDTILGEPAIEHPIIIGKPIIKHPPKIIGTVTPFIPNPSSIAETMPEFPGGIDSLNLYIKQNLKYPEWEKKREIQGITTVSFIISRDGMIYKPQIIKSVPSSQNFDAEVIRLIRSMPKWIPAKNGDQLIDIQYNLNIEFKL